MNKRKVSLVITEVQPVTLLPIYTAVWINKEKEHAFDFLHLKKWEKNALEAGTRFVFQGYVLRDNAIESVISQKEQQIIPIAQQVSDALN